MAGLLAFLLTSLVLGFVAWKLVGLYIDRAVSTAELAAGLCGILGWLSLLALTWGTPWGYGIFGLTLAGAASLPWAGRRLDGLARRRLWEQDLEECRRALEFDPNNWGAYERMGEIYEQMGRWDEAIETYQRVLALKGVDAGLTSRLNHLLKKKRLREAGLVECHHCGAEVPQGTSACPQCGGFL
ncbi:MAG TPA: tetratricopeptide repeat protein [Armatimonadetes bacterium]|nr:tetratricopeptide repeat protein [Armatimonadota bacterium]